MEADRIHPKVYDLVEEVKGEAERRSLVVGKNIENLNKISNVDERVEKFKQYLLDSRKSSEDTSESVAVPAVDIKDIDDLSHGTHIRAKVYSPAGARDHLPCIYHIHGGGLLVGGIDEDINRMALISKTLDCIIMDIEYRLAPEFKFPTPQDDCYIGFQYCYNHAEKLGIDPERLSVMGESAGGGLAASVAIRSIRENGPQIRNLFLMAPMLDYRNNSLSSTQYDGNWPFWSTYYNKLGWKGYLGSQEEVSELASPSLATDLEGFPETYIEVGFDEVFRDESVAFASRILNSKRRVDLHVYEGIFHGFEYVIPEAALTKTILEYRYLKMKKMIHSRI